MAKGKRKRKLEKKNEADARKIIMITIIITVVFVIIAYLAFLRSQ